MDYDQIIQKYRANYSHLAENALAGSIERHAYEQIVQYIDDGLNRAALNAQTNTPSQKGFEVSMLLKALAQVTNEPGASQITKKCASDFAHETGFDDLNVRAVFR